MTRRLAAAVRAVRSLDVRIGRQQPVRRILVDARTPVNFTIVAPVVRGMAADDRIRFFYTASEEPERLAAIYREATTVRTIHPARAALMRFDAYVASDYMWARLPRGTERVQVFHGVGGKYGFDAPTESLRAWDRLFFVNQRRLANIVAAGAIEADSPAIRMIGMPKTDCLVDGSLNRERVLADHGLDPARPTVVYAPTWSPASSLNAIGVELVTRLRRLPVNLIVKLHDRSRDLRQRYSGGVDWVAALQPLMAPGQSVLAPAHDITPYLVASDVMVTDHSSCGFEYLLRDKPIVRIHCPALIELANVHPDYVALLASVAESTGGVDDTLAAVESALANPDTRSAERRRVAADLFYRPGGATRRSIEALYELIELDPAAAPALGEVRCRVSA